MELELSDVVGPPDRHLSDVREELNDLTETLDHQRLARRSGPGNVEVVVSGAGAILDIAIKDQALVAGNAPSLGAEIVAAVSAARAVANQSTRATIDSIVDPTVSAVPSPTRRRPPAEEEESFEHIDFVADPHGGSARW